MSQLAVAQQLRTLASDPENQTFIVNEKECMNGLLAFLDSADSEVVVVSLQALQFLSSHPSNQGVLAAFPGLLLKLTGLTDSEDRNLRKVALATLDNLQNYINREAESQQPAKKAKAMPRYLHEWSIFLDNMITVKDRNRVEGCMIALEGVVSVTIDLVQQKCTVYSNQPQAQIQETVVQAVRSQGFALRNDDVDDVIADENAFKQQRNQSSYLSAAPAAPASASASAAAAGPSKAYLDAPKPGSLTVYGGVEQNSLQARYNRRKQKQKEEQEKKGAVRSLFGAVSSYFW